MLDFEAFDEIDDEFGEGRLVFDGGLDEDGIVIWGFDSCDGIVAGRGGGIVGDGIRIIHKHIITLLLDIWKKV